MYTNTNDNLKRKFVNDAVVKNACEIAAATRNTGPNVGYFVLQIHLSAAYAVVYRLISQSWQFYYEIGY